MTEGPRRFPSGVVPVLETPFHADGRIDMDGFLSVADHVLSTGVSGVAFPGFASEFHKLSPGEREILVAALLDRTRDKPDVGVVVSVSEHATLLAVKAAESAVAAGADAINVIPPYFLAPSATAVRTHLESVLDAVASVPVVVQHSPALTGLSLAVPHLTELAARYPNFRTVKVESTPPGPMVTALASAQPSLGALVGYGGLHMIDAFRRGAIGVQPGCSFTELYVTIWDAWLSGEQQAAESLHRRLLSYLTYWMQEVELLVQVEKTISLRRGLIGSDHCRRPGRPLDDYELAGVDRFLSEFAELLS